MHCAKRANRRGDHCRPSATSIDAVDRKAPPSNCTAKSCGTSESGRRRQTRRGICASRNPSVPCAAGTREPLSSARSTGQSAAGPPPDIAAATSSSAVRAGSGSWACTDIVAVEPGSVKRSLHRCTWWPHGSAGPGSTTSGIVSLNRWFRESWTSKLDGVDSLRCSSCPSGYPDRPSAS